MKHLSAWISFSAEGDALLPFRDALRTAHFPCKDQQLRGGIFYARTKAHNWYGIRQLAAQHGIALTVCKRQGIRYLLAPYRLRIGVLCGLLCGAALLWWCSATVRSIEINGNQTVSDTEILAALEELGITRGTRFRDIEFTNAEQRMRLAVHDIEWIALRHVGGRLIVDLTEERRAPEMYDDRIPTNYVATVPAQITGISVLGGYAVKQIGDPVKAGELIISGVQEDARGICRYYHADGVVTGIYEAEFYQEQPFCEEISVRGDTKTETVLDLFGKRFSLTVGFRQPAGDIIYEEEPSQLTLFGHPMPFALIRCRYTQSDTAIAVYSEDEARAMLEEAARRYEQNFHADDAILSRECDFQRTDLGISLKIHYVFEGVIGETSEIFVKLS